MIEKYGTTLQFLGADGAMNSSKDRPRLTEEQSHRFENLIPFQQFRNQNHEQPLPSEGKTAVRIINDAFHLIKELKNEQLGRGIVIKGKCVHLLSILESVFEEIKKHKTEDPKDGKFERMSLPKFKVNIDDRFPEAEIRLDAFCADMMDLNAAKIFMFMSPHFLKKHEGNKSSVEYLV